MPARAPKPVPQSRPSVFEYLDARRFLAAISEHAKAQDPKFSHRYVAKAMGARSSGFLKDILNGRVRLSPERAVKFARLFGLTRAEADHFESLALYGQATTTEEKERILARLSAGSSMRRVAVLEAARMEYFGKWRYAAVRELLAIYDFRGDTDGGFAALGAMLDPPLTESEAREAIQLLLRLKLIRRNAQGRYERADTVIRSGPDRAARVKPTLRDNLQLALRALESLPPAVRPFSYLTLSVSKDSLEAIRARLSGLRSELLDIASRDEEVDRLIQVNFQVFPISKTVKKGKS